MEKRVRALLLAGREEVVAPQHFLLTPKREVLIARQWHLPKEELLRLLRDEIEYHRDPRKAVRGIETRVGDLVQDAVSGDGARAGRCYGEIASLLKSCFATAALEAFRKRTPVVVREGLVHHLVWMGASGL